MILSIFAVLALFGPVSADQQVSDADVVVGKLGKRIEHWVRCAQSTGFSGSILAAKSGEVVAAFGVGTLDPDKDELIDSSTLFEIASATKQFTAAAIMCLVQDGKLSLSDPISEHLPGIPKDCREITVRHLLQHTSGIPGSNSKGTGNNIRSVIPTFLQGGPQHTPGSHFEYWNQGYALLTEVIARLAKQEYTEYCKQALFEPAGMAKTCFTGDKVRDLKVAIGRSSRGPSRSALDHPYGSYGFQYRGMGGAVTNVWDLWRWDRALHTSEVLNSQSKELLFTPGLENYALGWYVKKTKTGRLVQSHRGSVRGFVCDVRRSPDQDALVVVLCNRDNARAMYVAQAIEEMLFDEPATMQQPPSVLEESLSKKLEGEYKDEKGRKLVVERDGVVTRARIYWSPDGPVTYATLGLNEDQSLVFYEWKSETELQFDGSSKKAKVLTLSNVEYRRAR